MMTCMKRFAISLLLAVLFVGSIAGDEVRRPRVLGVSHMALFVSDLKKARAFYEDFLGYQEPYVLKRDDGTDRIIESSVMAHWQSTLLSVARENLHSLPLSLHYKSSPVIRRLPLFLPKHFNLCCT